MRLRCGSWFLSPSCFSHRSSQHFFLTRSMSRRAFSLLLSRFSFPPATWYSMGCFKNISPWTVSRSRKQLVKQSRSELFFLLCATTLALLPPYSLLLDQRHSTFLRCSF